MSRSLLGRFRSMWGSLFQSKESPREFQERQDLYKSILALNYRNRRHEKVSTSINPTHAKGSETNRYSSTLYQRGIVNDREELEKLLEEVTAKLDSEMEIYRMSIKGLRYELQNLLIPQILHIFQAFHEVDKEMNLANLITDDKCWEILRHEHEESYKKLSTHGQTKGMDVTTNMDSFKAYHFKAHALFLQRKIQSIETLFSHYHRKDLDYKYLSEAQENQSTDDIDSLGYDPTLNKEQVSAKRYHQLLNITKSTLLRQRLGFSVLALKSTIPNGGRGIFLDGFAPAGSLLAFFPGQIWPKEYLLSNENISSWFKEDLNFMLSLRYDDILIDSRKAPRTALSHERNSNPFCVAHIANHPPPLTQIMDLPSVPESHLIIPPNCHTVMLNFTQDMNLRDQDLEKYLPNTYARPPQMLGSQLFDRDVVSLHGMGLLASRDVYDEELFYDYRLSPTQQDYPPWYSIVDETDLRNRWSHDKDKGTS